MNPTVEKISREKCRDDIPDFTPGDTLRVDVRIVEGGKERIQAFTGIAIGHKRGGTNETVTLRRTSYGQGVERVFPLHSPRVDNVTVVRAGHERRAKLYNLREGGDKKKHRR